MGEVLNKENSNHTGKFDLKVILETGLQIRVCTGKLFSYFSTKTYVVGTQKNRLNEHPKQMFKLLGKEINAILGAQTILIWTYVEMVEDISKGAQKDHKALK